MIGNVFYDVMTVPTNDDDRFMVYPAWTVCGDDNLQISSDKVIQDKIQRTITQDASQVVIPIAGTPEINSNVHLSLRKNLKDHKIEFLKDESEMEILLAEDEDWVFKSSEERADILLPYVETRIMVNESISLKQKMTSGGIGVVEDRDATKDRYMAVGYFNHFCDKLENKYSKEENESDEDLLNLQLVW